MKTVINFINKIRITGFLLFCLLIVFSFVFTTAAASHQTREMMGFFDEEETTTEAETFVSDESDSEAAWETVSEPTWETTADFEENTYDLQDGPEKEPDEYDSFADTILQAIIEDSMDDYQRCSAVYDYIHEIPYINRVYSEDWKENGYYMLYERGGDCFGYYSASRLLLERLGYEVIEVQNCNGFIHVWCLVSTDGGETWLHFDPTVWRWGSEDYLCLVTDEELEDYGRRHAVGINLYSHDWNRQAVTEAIERYPEDPVA